MESDSSAGRQSDREIGRWLHGWRCWLEGFRRARGKRHGAGRSSLRQALRMAAWYRYLVDGQHR